ncbi:MAG: hypothetical protein IKK75_06790 [Clostridia bacterium]|nr:hypothetical protein [Clostridia bacterium]
MENQYNTETQQTPEFSMKWHNFLIYFALWAGAVVMLLNAFMFFTGSIEGEYVQMIYSRYPSIKGVHMFMGVLCVGTAVLSLVARFALAGYKANALTLLCLVYVCNALVNPLYLVLSSMICGIPLGELFDSSIISGLVMPIVMIFVNRDYYGKRSALFIN